MLAVWFVVAALAGLPVRESSLDVQIIGIYAELTWTQVLGVEGQAVEDAVIDVPKGPGSAITAVDIALGDDRVLSRTADPNTAQQRYSEGLRDGRVAGITLRDEADRLRIVLDELPDEPIRVSVSWTATARLAHGGVHLELPIAALGADPLLSIHLIGPVPIEHVELDADLPPMRGAPGEVVLKGRVDGSENRTLRWTLGSRRLTAAAATQGPVTLVWAESPASVSRRRAVPRDLVFSVDESALARPRVVRRALLDAIVRLDRRDTVRVAGMAPGEPLARSRPATAEVRLELKRWVRDLDRAWVGHVDGHETEARVAGESPWASHRRVVLETARLPADPRPAIRRFVTEVTAPILTDVSIDHLQVPDVAPGAPAILLTDSIRRDPAIGGTSSDGAWFQSLPRRPAPGTVLSTHHALLHLEDRPNLALNLGLPAPNNPLVLVRTARDGTETWAVPVDIRLSGLARAIAEVHTDTVSASEVIEVIATGRSYQSAVGLAAGVSTNPNRHSAGASNENTYMLDGANLTDPVTGTFSVNFNFDAVEQVGRYVTGLLPRHQGARGGVIEVELANGTNTLEYAVGWKRAEVLPERVPGTEVTSTVGGPLVQDHLWSLGSFEYLEAPDRDLRSLSLSNRLTAQPSSEHRLSGFAAISTTDTGVDRPIELGGALGQAGWEWFASPDLGLELKGTLTATSTGADRRSRQQLMTRLWALSQRTGRADHDLELGADLERIGWKPGGRIAAAWPVEPTELAYDRIGLYAQDSLELDRLRLDGGLRVDRQHDAWLPAPRAYGGIDVTNTTRLTAGFGRSWSPIHFADSLAPGGPRSTRKDEWLAWLDQEFLDDFGVVLTGSLQDFDGLLGTDLSRQPLQLLNGRIEVRKEQAMRWSARAAYTRTAILEAPGQPLYGLQELGRFQDRVTAHAVWDLPTDPWTQTIWGRAELRLNPLLPAVGDPSGLQIPTPASRILEAGFQQRIDLRKGDLDVQVQYRHLELLEQVDVPDLLLLLDPLPDLPGYEGHRVQLGIEYSF